jgi:periplasmic divalent cation tolerance protein
MADGGETLARLVLVTVPNVETGEAIARRVVVGRLAACANLTGPIRSYYHWQGQYEESAEHLLILKTQLKCVPALLGEVTAAHPYECPVIEVVAVEKMTEASLGWILRETDATRGP